MGKTQSKNQISWEPEMFPVDSKEMNESNEILSDLIKINTTNTDELDSGDEINACLFLKKILEKEGFKNIEIIESIKNRASIITRWEGSERNYPSLCLLAHLDVVPAIAENWDREPFSGDIEGEYIWGRGALDCKGMVASELMAVIFLKRKGYLPKGDIILAFTADEETGGELGLGYLVEHHYEKIKADLTINEGGGILLPLGKNPKDYVVQTGEKGVFATRIRVKGQGGHGSMPVPKKKNAMYKISKITQKVIDYKPPIVLTPTVLDMMDAISLPSIAKKLLKIKWLIRPLLKIVQLVDKSIPQVVLPLVMDILSPTGLKGSEKINNIPQTTEMLFDCRLLPGNDRKTVENHLKRALGKKLFSEIEIIEFPPTQPATINPKNPELWNNVKKIMDIMHPGSNLVPMLSAGSTDSKFIRSKGGYALGFCPMRMDPNMPYSEMGEMVHGKNERIWISNYAYAIEFFTRLIENF